MNNGTTHGIHINDMGAIAIEWSIHDPSHNTGKTEKWAAAAIMDKHDRMTALYFRTVPDAIAFAETLLENLKKEIKVEEVMVGG